MTLAARRIRTAILISGRGSNMTALIEAARSPDFPAEIVLVAANRPGAGGLERASAAGIPAVCVDHKAFAGREAFERALQAEIERHDVDLVCLAGFMRVLTPWFIERWQGRLLNIHPSLLPLFPGLHTHERALAEGVRLHGATVHYVVPELDAGNQIIYQSTFTVPPGMKLADIVHVGQEDNEPRCLVEGVRRVVDREVELHFHRVVARPGRQG